MSNTALGLGIIGCGLIGTKRALQAERFQVRCVTDLVDAQAKMLADKLPGCERAATTEELLARDDVDAVVVATTHDTLASTSLAALDAGKHVLVEKPVATDMSVLEELIEKSVSKGLKVKVGFNHRFHPAFLKAREILETGALGPLMFIRGRYGHGGRVGYEKEWRADKRKSGGGELIDQGIHLIDLAGWFLGDFEDVQAYTPTYFWDMEVEDNAFLMLRTAGGQAAWLHASWTEWKNMFSFEIYGRDAKIDIDGLGGSYGVERITYYKMLPEMGPPDTQTWKFTDEDRSWAREMENFASAILGESPILGGLPDARAALRVVERAYAQ